MTELLHGPALAPGGLAAGPRQPGNVDALRHVAQEFEAIFLAQVLANINQGFGGDEGEAGGQALFHDMFNQEVAKLISRTGGVGVADAVLKEMLKLQEMA